MGDHLECYQYFVGDLWERYGQDAWLGPWKQVYARKADSTRDVVAELEGIADREAQLSAQMVLDGVQDAEAGRQALSAAYDDVAVTELAVYTLGDGEAMSGLLVSGWGFTHSVTV